MSENIIFFHGFTQTKASFKPFVESLKPKINQDSKDDFNLITFDLPGHGNAGEVESNFNELNNIIETYLPAHFLGYSLGARLAAKCAIDLLPYVKTLSLISCNPGITDILQRAERAQQDFALADKLSKMNGAEFKTFIDEWVRQPLFGNHIPNQDDLNARYLSNPKGLADSLINFGQGNFVPIWEQMNIFSKVSLKVLIVAGSNDLKYRNIAYEIAKTTGDTSILELVEDAFHSPHLERSDTVAELYANFLLN